MIKNTRLYLLIQALAYEKDIPKDILVDAIRQSILLIARQEYNQYADIIIDESCDNSLLKRRYQVVEQVTDDQTQISINDPLANTLNVGDFLLQDLDFGRISISAIKQNLNHIIADITNKKILESIHPLTVIAASIIMDYQDYFMLLLKPYNIKASILKTDLLPVDRFRINDDIKVCLKNAFIQGNKLKIFVTRNSKDFLISIIKSQSDFYENDIQIVDCVREPGVCSKVVVSSLKSHIDPVGVIIGVKGNRIKVISDIFKERVDIVAYNKDTILYALNCLSIHNDKVFSVLLDKQAQLLEVFVDPSIISLAIGHNGINVKLASKLCKFKISICQRSKQENFLTKKEQDILNDMNLKDFKDIVFSDQVPLSIKENTIAFIFNKNLSKNIYDLLFIPYIDHIQLKQLNILYVTDLIDNKDKLDNIQINKIFNFIDKVNLNSKDIKCFSDKLNITCFSLYCMGILANIKIHSWDDIRDIYYFFTNNFFEHIDQKISFYCENKPLCIDTQYISYKDIPKIDVNYFNKNTKQIIVENDVIKDVENDVIKDVIKSQPTPKKQSNKVLVINNLTVKKIAFAIKQDINEILKIAQDLDSNITPTSLLDKDIALLVCQHFGVYCISDEKTFLSTTDLVKKRPIVCFMGHVDHGKTTLIDALQKTYVSKKEAGGITQSVTCSVLNFNNDEFTIIDSPGHFAFSFARSKVIGIVDIMVLVIAIDDGINEQTKEVISIAQENNLQIIVAITKSDKQGFNTDKIFEELARNNIFTEKMGGDVQSVLVSALEGKGLQDLIDAISITAQIMDLKAYNKGFAECFVIDCFKHPKLGIINSLIVKNGCLQDRQIIAGNKSYGKIRSMLDWTVKTCKQAYPGDPVQITGVSELEPGETAYIVPDEKTALKIISVRSVQTEQQISKILDNKQNVLLKGDNNSSLQALKQVISVLDLNIIFEGIGDIVGSDINRAIVGKSIILSFRCLTSQFLRQEIKKNNLILIESNIIYSIYDDLSNYLLSLKPEDEKLKTVASAKVIAVFPSSAFKSIAGAHIVSGTFFYNQKVRVIRNGKMILADRIKSLRYSNTEVKETKKDTNVGMGIKGYQAEIDDIIEGI